MFHIAAVQRAVYEALIADATLSALVGGRILDDGGHNATFPYVSIGESTITPDDCLDRYGAIDSLTIHAWSRQPGMQESATVMEAIYRALDDKRHPVAGFQWVECRCEFAQTLRDLDGITRHGVMRFRVRTFDEQ